MTVALSLTQPTMTAVPTAREEAAAARRESRLADSRQALQTLKQIRAAPKADQKAIALQKIARLKEQIKMLQMTASGDPARTAKIAAQLARELASAIKAYAASGGAAADVGATPSVRPTTEPSPEAGSSTAPAEGAVAPEKTVATSSSKAIGAEDEDPNAGNLDAKADAEQNPYRQAIETAQQRINDQARRAGEARGDAEFLTQVKALASQLKHIIRQAAQKAAQAAEAGGETAPSPETREAERALAAVEKEIEAATRSLSSGSGVSILV